MSDDSGPFKKEYLTVRDHIDPDKHWIGETLPAASVGDIQYAGVTTAVGVSTFPARADHSHDVRTRQTFVNNTSKSVASGASTYIDGLTTAAGWEDFLHSGSSQIVDFPIEGVYIVNNRVSISRSTGTFPVATQYLIQFNYNNLSSIHEVELGNLPDSRSRYTTTITEIVSFGAITGVQNVQFLYQNTDSVAHNVTMRIIIQRSASSIEAETE